MSRIVQGQQNGISKWFDGILQRLRVFVATPFARYLVLGIFVAQATLLVFTVHIGTPPDESNHINFIEYYAHHSLGPVFSHQQPTYSLGDKTREVDYLYHYVMSLLYRILPLSVDNKYLAIRLCSVGLGLLSLVILGKVLKRLGLSPATITLTFLLLANVPMVLMMSSAINNDVLVWLGMLLGMLLLLRLWERPQVTDLVWLADLSFIGGLVKRTLLPLGLLFGVLAILIAIRHFRPLLAQLKTIRWELVLALLIFVIGLGLFTERVGGNLLRYHTPTPSCEQVDGTVACSVFWVNVRAHDLATQPAEAVLPLPQFGVAWVFLSLYNVVDIQTQFWLHEVKPAFWLIPLLSFLLLFGIGYGFYYERKRHAGADRRQSRWRVYVALIGLYLMVVHLLYNYSSYLDIKSFGLALNGRYIIPSLLPLTGLACFYWLMILRRHPRLVVIVAMVAVVATAAGSGLIMMLRNEQLYYPKSSLSVTTSVLGTNG